MISMLSIERKLKGALDMYNLLKHPYFFPRCLARNEPYRVQTKVHRHSVFVQFCLSDSDKVDG